MFMARDHAMTIPDGTEIPKATDAIDYNVMNASVTLDQDKNASRTELRYARPLFAESKRNPQLLDLYKMVYTGSPGSDKDEDAWVERAHELEGRRLAAYNLLRALIGAAMMKSVFTASSEPCWEDRKSHLTHLVSTLKDIFTEQGSSQFVP